MNEGARRLPLAFLGEGREGVVVEVRGGSGFQRRLADVGIYPGSRVRVVRSTGRGPVMVEVLATKEACKGCPFRALCPSASSSYRISLGFGTAMRVLVEEA